MQKSKSWLKSLLIVVMAIMLVFSLVACNKNNNPDSTPVDESAADYFTALWNSTKPIGATAIENGKDISLSFGFELSVDTIDEKADPDDAIYQQIDLGFDVHAVIGRTKSTAGNTAIKLRLYDPTDANHTEILSLYAFANDLDNLYIDFAGKNIKMPHNLESLIWNEIFGNEGTAAEGLADFLTNQKFNIGGAQKSFNDIINMITADFGSNWSLNSVVDNVLTLVGMDANAIITLLRENGFEVAITSLFSVNRLEDLLVNGKLDILRILTNDALGGFLSATRQKVGDATIHKAKLNQLIGMLLEKEVAEVIFDKGDAKEGAGEVSLLFTEKNGAIQDLTVYAQFYGLRSIVGNRNLIPEISLKITEFSIEGLASNNSNGISIDKTKYSDTIAFDETVELAASGIKILKLNDNSNDIFLNGKIIINVKGQLDIINTNDVISKNEAITENKTKANISVKLVNGNEDPKTIAEVSYANGKIAGKVDSSIDLGLIDPNWSGKTGFVYSLGENFNVADMVQNYIKSLFNKSESSAITSATTIPAPILSLAEKIQGGLEVALGLITTPNNHLNIATSNILATVVQFKESIFPGGGTESAPAADKWTVNNRIEAICNSLLNPPLDADLNGCLNILMEQLENIANDPNCDWREVMSNCKDAALTALYNIAQNVRIDGVATTGLKASDYTAFKKDGVSITDNGLMIYVNNIKAVLAAQITIDGDLQDGIHASITIKIADATLSASTSLTLVENATFTDLYKEYTNAADKSNWIDLNAQA